MTAISSDSPAPQVPGPRLLLSAAAGTGASLSVLVTPDNRLSILLYSTVGCCTSREITLTGWHTKKIVMKTL